MIHASQTRLLQDCDASTNCEHCCVPKALRYFPHSGLRGAGIAGVDDESRALGEVQIVDTVVFGGDGRCILDRDPVTSITISASSRIDVSTRSVRSQEKPPSVSDGRPKWP
jgi:hypothetical protein